MRYADAAHKTVFFACVFIFFGGALLPVFYMIINALFSIGDSSLIAEIASEKDRYWSLMRNTLSISIGTAVASILLGAPLAFILSRVSFPMRSAFLLIYPLPLLIPPYVHTICWIDLLGKSGWFSRLTPSLSSSEYLYSPLGVIFILTLSYYPLVALISYIGFSMMNRELEDAARIHANRMRSLWNITWKLAMPSILIGGLFIFILSLSGFGVPSMLRVNVYSLDVFYQFSTLHRVYHASLSVLPLLLLSFVALILIHGMEKNPRFLISTSCRKGDLINTGRWRWFIFPSVLFLHMISVFLPISVLLGMAGKWDNYLSAISNARQDILISFWSSLIASTGTVLIGGILAVSIWYISSKKGEWLERISILSFAFPAAATGIGIIELWNREGIFQVVYSSIFILIIAYFCRYISFAFKPVWMTIKYIDCSLDESAQVAGIPWWKRIFHITAPLSMKGIVGAWFLVYFFSLSDLDISLLVHPPGKGTLPVRIFNLLHFGRQEWVAALCIILIALTVLPYIILNLWGFRESNVSPGMSSNQ